MLQWSPMINDISRQTILNLAVETELVQIGTIPPLAIPPRREQRIRDGRYRASQALVIEGVVDRAAVTGILLQENLSGIKLESTGS